MFDIRVCCLLRCFDTALRCLWRPFFEIKVAITRIRSYEVNEAVKEYCARLFRLEKRVCRWAQGEAQGSGEAAERVLCARVQGY